MNHNRIHGQQNIKFLIKEFAPYGYFVSYRLICSCSYNAWKPAVHWQLRVRFYCNWTALHRMERSHRKWHQFFFRFVFPHFLPCLPFFFFNQSSSTPLITAYKVYCLFNLLTILHGTLHFESAHHKLWHKTQYLRTDNKHNVTHYAQLQRDLNLLRWCSRNPGQRCDHSQVQNSEITKSYGGSARESQLTNYSRCYRISFRSVQNFEARLLNLFVNTSVCKYETPQELPLAFRWNPKFGEFYWDVSNCLNFRSDPTVLTNISHYERHAQFETR